MSNRISIVRSTTRSCARACGTPTSRRARSTTSCSATAASTGIATRVATDKDIQDELRSAISELRNAADRVQGKAEEERAGRNSALLLIGIVLGILFNPFTGPATRKWLSDKAFGGGDDFTYQGSGSNGS